VPYLNNNNSNKKQRIFSATLMQPETLQENVSDFSPLQSCSFDKTAWRIQKR